MRAQRHFREVLIDSNVLPLSKPLVPVSRAHRNVGNGGRLPREVARWFSREQMQALLAWTRRVQEDPLPSAKVLRDKDEG